MFHDIIDMVAWTAHSRVWMMSQVAFCWLNFLLDFGTWQNQWCSTIGLNDWMIQTEPHGQKFIIEKIEIFKINTKYIDGVSKFGQLQTVTSLVTSISTIFSEMLRKICEVRISIN